MSLKLEARPVREVVPGRVLLVDADLLLYLSRDPDEPLEYVLHSVKEMLLDIQEKTQCETMRCILSSPTNFRYEIFPEYKANRKDKEKPPHYQATKEYLIKHWDAEVADDGLEADDEIAQLTFQEEGFIDEQFIILTDDIYKNQTSLITATLDKDFMTVPGWYYRWRGHNAGNVYWVNEEDAMAFLAYQLLTGDSADGIISPLKAPLKDGKLGKTGYGHVKARDFLLQFEYAEMKTKVYELYCSQGFREEFHVNYKLLAIGRTEV